jgi:hypothetical protein
VKKKVCQCPNGENRYQLAAIKLEKKNTNKKFERRKRRR